MVIKSPDNFLESKSSGLPFSPNGNNSGIEMGIARRMKNRRDRKGNYRMRAAEPVADHGKTNKTQDKPHAKTNKNQNESTKK